MKLHFLFFLEKGENVVETKRCMSRSGFEFLVEKKFAATKQRQTTFVQKSQRQYFLLSITDAQVENAKPFDP